MRKYFLTAVVLAAAFGLSAQKLDLQSLSTLHRHELQHSRPGVMRIGTPAKTGPQTSLAFVTIADGYTESDLTEAGMEVISVRGNLAIVKVSMADASRLSEHESVKAMSLQRPVKANIDKARAENGVDQIHFPTESTRLTHYYTSKGDVASIVA